RDFIAFCRAAGLTDFPRPPEAERVEGSFDAGAPSFGAVPFARRASEPDDVPADVVGAVAPGSFSGATGAGEDVPEDVEGFVLVARERPASPEVLWREDGADRRGALVPDIIPRETSCVVSAAFTSLTVCSGVGSAAARSAEACCGGLSGVGALGMS